MKKKNILFIMPYLGCGGVESTLFSLLANINRDKFTITLLLLEKKGAFSDRIPSDICVKYVELPEREWGIFYGKKKILMNYITKCQLWKIPAFLHYNIGFSLTEDRKSNAVYFDRIAASIPELPAHYDLAIDYFGFSTFTTFYLAEKVRADVKVSWLHSTFSNVFSSKAFEKWYKKMDVIFACSETVKSDFEEMFPSIKSVRIFYNIINPNLVREKASMQGGFNDNYDGIRILTVGRISPEKKIEWAIDVFKKLIGNGYRIRWYVVGDGSKEEMHKLTSLLCTDYERENFIFLGLQDNPYVFMKQCDIYVQTSMYEGYCTTTNEARIIGCPIVMTDVSGANEQINNGINGFVVRKDPKEIYSAVKYLLDNPEQRLQFRENLLTLDCDTRSEIQKLERLLR